MDGEPTNLITIDQLLSIKKQLKISYPDLRILNEGWMTVEILNKAISSLDNVHVRRILALIGVDASNLADVRLEKVSGGYIKVTGIRGAFRNSLRHLTRKLHLLEATEKRKYQESYGQLPRVTCPYCGKDVTVKLVKLAEE